MLIWYHKTFDYPIFDTTNRFSIHKGKGRFYLQEFTKSIYGGIVKTIAYGTLTKMKEKANELPNHS